MSETTLPSQEKNTSPVVGYAVHALTASGIIFTFLAIRELMLETPEPRWVLIWLGITLLIDMIDGPLARRLNVKEAAPRIDGRALDDVIDYLTFTFIPLLLVWRMGWLPGDGEGAPGLLASCLVALTMAVSLFGFANTGAKQESEGFFLGFPSYFNLYAVYAGLFAVQGLLWLNAIALIVLTILVITPVRFIYPNLAPRPWYWPSMIGGLIWGALLVGMLPWYPHVWPWLTWVTLLYPIFYLAVSWSLDWAKRRGG